jgi:hypothetical protein
MEERGWAARPGREGLESHEVLFVDLIAPGEAQLAVCVVSDSVVFEVASGNVVNDVITTTKYDVEMIRGADAWRLRNSLEAQRLEGVASCSAF